ncbi:MAG: hypothetical protein IPL03_10140 [Sterolibacteriaceae bacterium]|nr:hypothetical protein [Candidatus Methylophosphatis haderslevensis]
MRELTLVISGLLWPADSLADACRDLALPALETLLGRGVATTLPPATLDETLAGLWDLPPDSAPYAALRVAGSGGGGEGGDACWMCADPVHLRFARESLVLTDRHELDLALGEARELVDALNGAFADVGEFTIATPGEWNLRLNSAPQLVTHSVAQVLGRSIEPFLPGGPDGAQWRRIINEMQMLLHAHPVNQAREAQGRLAINSVWPWGAGSLGERLPLRHQTVFADTPLARGLARASGGTAGHLPAGFTPAADGSALAVLDSLYYPAVALEVGAWQAALRELETAWFRPLLDALRRRRTSHARIILTGDAACVDIRCGNAGWWKFWQRPLALETFLRQVTPP